MYFVWRQRLLRVDRILALDVIELAPLNLDFLGLPKGEPPGKGKVKRFDGINSSCMTLFLLVRCESVKR